MKKIYHKFIAFLGTWTGSIGTALIFIFFVAQSFIIPSGSMKYSLLIGDMIIGKKFAYGIPIPRLPIIDLPILPDFFGNGHLIEGDKPKREDIVIFLYPKDNSTHYVKRCVAVGGDEIIYINKKLYIHFHEGDGFIKKNYKQNKIINIQNKLWVENPYIDKYPNILYDKKSTSLFTFMLRNVLYGQKMDMNPIYIETLKAPVYKIKNKKINAFYTKVPPKYYYMIGDNRENSNDSRFWGPVPYHNIIAKPWFILFSLEHRSYEHMLNGDKNGSGKDNYGLKLVCKDTQLASKACKKLWNKQRFHIRWYRFGRSIEWVQKQKIISP